MDSWEASTSAKPCFLDVCLLVPCLLDSYLSGLSPLDLLPPLGRRTSGRDWLGRRSLGRKQLSRRYLGNGFRALGICRERGEHHELLDIIKREILSLPLYYDLDAHGAHPLCLHLH